VTEQTTGRDDAGAARLNAVKRALFTPTSQTLWYRRVYDDFTVSSEWLQGD